MSNVTGFSPVAHFQTRHGAAGKILPKIHTPVLMNNGNYSRLNLSYNSRIINNLYHVIFGKIKIPHVILRSLVPVIVINLDLRVEQEPKEYYVKITLQLLFCDTISGLHFQIKWKPLKTFVDFAEIV